MHKRTRTLSAAMLAMCACASAAHAATQLYVGEYKFNEPLLTIIDTEGAVIDSPRIIPAADWLVVGLALDEANEKLYWTHGSFNAGRISRANLDGSGLEPLLANLTNPRGLALDLDDEKMYWSDTQDNRMYRANLDGTAIETIIDTGHQLGRPALDLVNDKLYFGNFRAGGTGEIIRANLDGSDPDPFIEDTFTVSAIALDVDGGRIYWVDSNTSFVSNHIARANLDGTDIEILYEGLPTSSGFTDIGLDLAAGRLYWTDEITAEEKGVWRANLDGSDAQRIYESPEGWNAAALIVSVDDGEVDCIADLDASGDVSFADLLELLAAWNQSDVPADLDGGGAVGFEDLLILLAAWGPCT